MPHKHEHRKHIHHKHTQHKHVHKIRIDRSILARKSMGKRRSIENLRDKHKGTEIWILGTGPSMDDYPDDFFDDKVSIGMKWAGMAFPNCTYNIFRPPSRDGIRKFLLMHPKFIKKFIYVDSKGKIEWLGKYMNDPIYMNGVKLETVWKRRGELPSDAKAKKIFFETVHCIKRKKKPCQYPIIECHLAWSIEAATILGAQKITCVGCEERPTKEGVHAKRLLAYYRGKIIPVDKRTWCEWVPKGGYSSQQIKEYWSRPHFRESQLTTRWLAQALAEYGVEVFFYHLKDSEQYKAGYLKVI